MSEAAVAPQAHPIGLIDSDDLRRSRLTVFFRYPLAIPHFVWLTLWGIAFEIAVLIAWVVTIFTGRVPDGLHRFLAGYVRYSTRVNAYVLLLANPWPPFTNSRPYPLDVRDRAGRQAQSRLTVFFRLLLAIPAFLLTYVFRIVNNLIAFLGWFYALFTGRASEGMKNLSVWLYRYEVQTYAYVFLLNREVPDALRRAAGPGRAGRRLIAVAPAQAVSRPASAGARPCSCSCRSAHLFVHYVTSECERALNHKLITNREILVAIYEIFDTSRRSVVVKISTFEYSARETAPFLSTRPVKE